jgi:hypothetical protein
VLADPTIRLVDVRRDGEVLVEDEIVDLDADDYYLRRGEEKPLVPPSRRKGATLARAR